MTTDRTQRGEAPAFLNMHAEWIKGSLGISQIEIARDLLTRTGAPLMSEGAMAVALSRWLNKQGLSGRALKAGFAAGLRQSSLAVSEFGVPAPAPQPYCDGKASHKMDGPQRGPDPLPTQESPEQQLDVGSPPAPVGASPSLSTEAPPAQSFGFAGQLPEKLGNADAPLVTIAPTKPPRKYEEIVKDDNLINSGDHCRHKSNLEGARTAEIEW